MSDEVKKAKSFGKTWIIFFLLFLILYFGYQFINVEGNCHPLVSNLFSMIVLLAFLVFTLHHNEFKEGKNEILKQATLYNYFKKIR